MAKYDIGPKIGIEGEKEYKEQIKLITQQMKTLDSSLEAAASNFDGLRDAEDQAAKKTDTLKEKVRLQTEQLEKQQVMLEKSTEKYGEANVITQKWKGVVNQSQIELNKLRRELELSENKLISFGNKMEASGEKLEKVGGKISSVGKSFTTKLTFPIAAAAVASFKYASDLNENINKTDVAFAQNAEIVKEWSKTTLNKYGLAQSTALEMAATWGDMGTSMELPLDTATEMSKTLVGLAADMASFKNISVERAQTALNAVYTGETESLKTLGIVMTEANLKEYALSKGIQKSYSEMTQAEKVTLRYQYVLSKTTNAQGDFERTSDGAANQMRIAQESAKELAAEFGKHLLPIGTEILKNANELLKAFNGLDDGTKDIIIKIGLVVSALGPFISILGKTINIVGKTTTGIGKLSKGLSSVVGDSKVAGSALSKFGKLLISPTGLALGLSAALVGLSISYYEATSAEAAHRREVNKIISSLKDEKIEYDNLMTAQADQIKNAESESKYYQNLYNELQTIVDQNGKVKKGYEDRANFITTKLSEAYGIEIQIVDGVISKYDDLKKSIEDSMVSTRAKNLLGAQEEAYTSAVKNVENVKDNIAALQNESENTAKSISDMNAKLKSLDVGSGAYIDLSKKILFEEFRLTEINNALSDAQSTLKGYQSEIATYEASYAAIQQGNYEEAVRLSNSLVQIKEQNNALMARSSLSELEAEKTNLAALEEIYKQTQSEMVKTLIDSSKKRIAQYELEKAKIDKLLGVAQTVIGNVVSLAQAKGASNVVNQVNNFYSPKALSPAETARLNRNNVRTTVRSLGG